MGEDASQADWLEKGRSAVEMFKEAKVQFEGVSNNAGIDGVFTGLLKWADHNKLDEIARKLRNVHELVTATAL